MKKVLIALTIALFLMPFVLAGHNSTHVVPCGEFDDVMNITTACPEPEPTIKKKSGGDGFIIAKDKTILGLTSEYDGKGFGLVMGGVNSQGRTIYINNGLYNLRKVIFSSTEYQRAIPFHFKSILPHNNKTIEEFEILFDDTKDINLDLTFRVKKDYQNPDFWDSNKKLGILFLYSDAYYNYYQVSLTKSDVISIVEENKKMEEPKEVEIEVPIAFPEEELEVPEPTLAPEPVQEEVGFWSKIKSWFS